MYPRRKICILPLTLLVLAGLAAPGQASFFDVFLETFQPGPPYPAPPVVTTVFDDLGGGLVPVQSMAQYLGSAGAGGVVYHTLAGGSDSGGGPGQIGVNSFFDIFLEVSTDSYQFLPDSFFDVFCEVSLPGGGTGALVPLNQYYPPTDPRRFFEIIMVPDSFFDVFFEVVLPGVPEGRIRYQWHGTLSPELQAAGGRFAAPPEVGLGPAMIDSFFDVFLSITCDAPVAAPVHVLTVQSTAELRTGPIAAQPQSWSQVKGLFW